MCYVLVTGVSAEPPADLACERFAVRRDAVACVLIRFPDAVAETYDRTGRRVQ